VPIVLVNRSDGGHRVSSVVSDDSLGMSLAVDHLTSLEHRRIGHIAGPQNVSTGKFRLDGFKAAMQAAGNDTPDSAIAVAVAFTRAAGRDAARALLDQSPTLTAVVAANDLIALGLYDVLKERGLTCPDDISIVGHNDMPFVDMISPPLTTVHIRHRQMGLHAARLLMNLVRDQSSGAADMVLKPELVVRESTAAV
jgi:LacI family transcriptional regulator